MGAVRRTANNAPGMHPSLSKAHGARNMPIGKDAITAFAATELSVTVTGVVLSAEACELTCQVKG
jgi:hypothetical protein